MALLVSVKGVFAREHLTALVALCRFPRHLFAFINHFQLQGRLSKANVRLQLGTMAASDAGPVALGFMPQQFQARGKNFSALPALERLRVPISPVLKHFQFIGERLGAVDASSVLVHAGHVLYDTFSAREHGIALAALENARPENTRE